MLLLDQTGTLWPCCFPCMWGIFKTVSYAHLPENFPQKEAAALKHILRSSFYHSDFALSWFSCLATSSSGLYLQLSLVEALLFHSLLLILMEKVK